MHQTLTANVVRNLVSVRALLDRAIDEARQAAEFRRTTGVVLLDAVNERLLYEATTFLGVAPKREFAATLEALVKVAGDIGPLADVLRLHRARNAIQHEGLGVDRDDVDAFVESTRAFATAIASVVFKTNIWTMSAGYAIASDRLAEPFFAAEQALKDGDATRCIRALDRALAVIRERAARFAGDSGHLRSSYFLARTKDQVVPYFEERVDAVEQLALLGSLGADASKVFWFQRLSREAVAATVEEAERALGYMFWWIVAFESSLLIGEYDRRRNWELEQRDVRASADHARVVSATAGPSHWGRFELTLQLGDVPASDQYDGWARALSDLMKADEVVGECQPTIDNTGRVGLAVLDRVDLAELRRRMDELLRNVEGRMQQEIDELVEEVAKDSAAYEQFDAEVDRHRHLLPGWVGDVHLIIERGGPDPGDSIGLWLNSRAGGNPNDFVNAVRAHPAVEQFYNTGGWRLRPLLPIDELARILDAFTPYVRSWAEEQAHLEHADRTTKQRFHNAFGDIAGPAS